MRRALRSFSPRASDSRPARAARAVLAAAVIACAGLAVAQTGDEADPVFSASELLDASERTGPNHTVAEAVRTPGNYHVFTLTSPFGTFEAEGTSQVAVRVQELAALAALQELSRAGVFARSAGESFLKVGTGVVDVVTDPVATAKGIGSGVKRFGVNLGRRTKRAVQRVTAADDTKGSAGTSGGTVAASAAKSLIGINGAMRRWAQRVGADPYTTSPVLREALESVAQVDVAGGIAAKVAVPIPVLIGTTADVGQLVWGRDPEELRKLNETRARELGASADGASTFFRNRAFTLTMQTRLIGALHAVAVPGAGDYVASAADAADAREALFFVESAELLRQQHEAAPVAAVLTDSRALVARRPAGEAVALLPLDWVRESAETTAEFRELARRATEELGATSLRLHVTGRVSARGAAALAAAGWRP
ncbi:MAG: hypothetical protein IT181_26025 [Acidobacteria bacterium]|nr:hypothetical protein [Acidobacteriota bacterium]